MRRWNATSCAPRRARAPQRRADALVNICRRALDAGELGSSRRVRPHFIAVVDVADTRGPRSRSGRRRAARSRTHRAPVAGNPGPADVRLRHHPRRHRRSLPDHRRRRATQAIPAPALWKALVVRDRPLRCTRLRPPIPEVVPRPPHTALDRRRTNEPRQSRHVVLAPPPRETPRRRAPTGMTGVHRRIFQLAISRQSGQSVRAQRVAGDGHPGRCERHVGLPTRSLGERARLPGRRMVSGQISIWPPTRVISREEAFVSAA
jgi:hypothetical protein